MADYLVTLVESVTYEVRVTAECPDDAEELALEELCQADDPNDHYEDSTGFDVDGVRKINAKGLVAA